MAGLMIASTALQGIGAMAGAAGTLASGNYAASAANYQAAQLRQNAAGEIAVGQRQMFDTQRRSQLLQSTAVAQAGASGVDASSGSPLTVTGDIAKRGEYQALLDMWQGENRATGLENQAAGVEYEGQEKQAMAPLSAFGTLAGGFGSALGTYGRYTGMLAQPRLGYGGGYG